MRFLLLFFTCALSFGAAWEECVRDAIPIEKALERAGDYVGKPFKVWISRSKRTGECFWKVKGTEGYVILQAESGEIIRFYRNRR